MIKLQSGTLTAGLVPEIGGSLAFLRLRGVDLMRPLTAEAEARGDVLGVASFPMLPYANRIDGNAFTFEGRTYTVQPNNGGERFNVHGSGWKSAWAVAELGSDFARLTLEHHAPDDPYHYRASQTYRLTPAGLAIEMAIENLGPDRMPFGFGHHPWFERDADVALRFHAREFWLEGPDGVPSDKITLPPELDFSHGAPLPSGWRNNCYAGWTGTADLNWPSRGVALRIEADPIFRHLMLYADPKQTFFCLEPQTNASGALNKTGDLGLVELGPGERAEGAIVFSVSSS